MWISKLELTNFKSYQHQIFDFPQPRDGKNIILIGGMNGFGKTSLLEAIYLSLYGKEAITYLARAGLKTNTGYPSFLERALHGQAIRNSRDSMSVMIQININEHEAFQFLRKWYFGKNGDWNNDEELLVYEVRAGIRQPQKSEGTHANELLERYLVPAHLAPFFFFDGEEVKKLADQSRVEQIKQGMEGLLGVVLLRKLSIRLEQYQANKNQGVSSVDEEKHRQLLEKLTSHEAQFKSDSERRYALENELEGLKIERQDLNTRIISSGGGGGDVATAKQIIDEQKDTEAELNKTEDLLVSIFSEKLPFHFVSQELRSELVSQLHAEIEKINWDDHKRSMEPGKARFMGRFYEDGEPTINPSLNDQQKDAVKIRLEAAWESLFFPAPEGCAENILHDYLYGGKREQVIDLMSNLKVGVKEILGLIERKEFLQRRVKELINRYTRIEGVDRDGTLAALNAELNTLNSLISQKDRDSADLNRTIKTLETDINNERAIYEREHEKFIQANPVKSAVAKAQRVCNLINELIPSLYTFKTQKLAEAMTDVYHSLAHKDQVARIDIDETGQTKVLSKEGDEIIFDRSAGENQLFATALIAGLAKVSGMDAPLVVDTPLGRLDSEHRKNILNFWVSDSNRQVILLSQDKEIDKEMYNHLEPHISKTFVLHHEQIGNGVGKTWAQENSYFGGEA
jgi:DNA sulfur modification protein DndD